MLSLYLVLLLVRSRQELFWGLAALLGFTGFAAHAEPRIAAPALFALAIVSFLAFVLPRRSLLTP